jgi:hypothetical protein
MQLTEKAPARLQMERERRRLGQVRKAFGTGIENMNAGTQVPMEFLLACVDYIKAAMDRLHAQDQRIHDLLRKEVPPSDREADAVLRQLDERLAASRTALTSLVAAAGAYRKSAGKDAASFAAAVATFMDVYFNILLKGQHSTLPLQEELFGLPEWDFVAGVSNEALQIEGTLFGWIGRLGPPHLNPAGMTGSRPQS